MNKFLILGRRIFFEFTQKRFSLVCTHFVLSLCKNSNCWEIPLSFLSSSPELITILVHYWSFPTFTYQDKSDNHTPTNCILFSLVADIFNNNNLHIMDVYFEAYNKFSFPEKFCCNKATYFKKPFGIWLILGGPSLNLFLVPSDNS